MSSQLLIQCEMDQTFIAYIGINASNRICEHGIKVSFTMEQETKQVGQSKNRHKQACLNGPTDEAVNDSVCFPKSCS